MDWINGVPTIRVDKDGNYVTQPITKMEPVTTMVPVPTTKPVYHDYTWEDPNLVLKIKLDD